ncbi:hypothetical protein C8T65DRAFT_672775 [Cerioporus squamosus]|nr:hypothetical protein C8T65DRAFT_672775 [Cerioporus squamosus]
MRSSPPSLDAMDRDQVSKLALSASIDEGTFEDVKFFAFSSRTSKGGGACAPRSLYGNSVCIRKTAPHFDVVLTQGFAESVLADLNAGYPSDRAAVIDNYDYASDSDLEDSDEAEDVGGAPGPPGVSPEDSATERGVPPSQDTAHTVTVQSDAVGPDTLLVHEKPCVALSGRPGRLVFIDDMAHRTWRAFIYYSYFGAISFAPLRSQAKSTPRKDLKGSRAGTFTPPECSPKSIYRLADKYDIKELKTKAAADIKSKLTPSNIFTELFSSFTCLHSEIQEMEVEYLCSALSQSKVMLELPIWIDYLAQGTLPPGASKAVSMLVSKQAAVAANPPPYPCSACDRSCVWYCKTCHKVFS